MQQWFITLCTIVFLLSCANTYIQAKRRAFILTCLGLTGILFCLSFLIAAISLPENKPFNHLNKKESIICHITGIMLAIQSMALFSIVFALSVELYVTFRTKNRAIRDSLILKSIIVFLCCFQPSLSIILNIILMLIQNIQIVDVVENGGWCNVRFGGNRWGVLFVRALPLWFISIPGALIACAAIIPSLIMAIKARRKHRESLSQSETNPTMLSRNQSSREVSNDNVVRPTSPSSPISENSPSDSPSITPSSNKISNEAITRMALYCILYSAIGIPYSIYGIREFFNRWKSTIIDAEEIVFCNYLSVGICMAILIIIFLIFATNGSSIKRYKEAYIWWKFNCFCPIYRFITRRKSGLVRNLESNSTSISIEENVNSMQEITATVSSKNSLTLKTKKRWSIFTSSRESLVEAEKARKIRQSTEDTITSTIDENTSPTTPLPDQKINRNTHNLSMSSSSTFSSATAIAIDSSEPQNKDLSNKSVPILGGLSPAPRRTPPLSNPLRDFNDDKDGEIIPPLSIERLSSLPRQTASAPTSPISTSQPNSYNQSRRFTSPLRGNSTPIVNNRSLANKTFGDMQEFDDDGTEPFPSLLKIGKSFNDEKGIWRTASTLSFASRPIRMGNSGAYNPNVWGRPNTEAISRLSSSPSTIRNPSRNNFPIVNDVNGRSSSETEKNKDG